MIWSRVLKHHLKVCGKLVEFLIEKIPVNDAYDRLPLGCGCGCPGDFRNIGHFTEHIPLFEDFDDGLYAVDAFRDFHLPVIDHIDPVPM
jgi:hypothetical protein